MITPRRLSGMLLVTLSLVAACASAPSGRMPPFVDSTDSVFFALTIDAVVSESREPLRVDPRPFRAGAMELSPDAVLDNYPMLAARKRHLAQHNLTESDLLKPVGCPGVLTTPDVSKSGCSNEHYLRVAVSLPQVSGPNAKVRTIEQKIGPHGSSRAVFELAFQQRQGAWHLVSRKPLQYIE